MSKKVDIVIGLGYGDEGKGLATDFLVNNSKKSIVIRFNGGHQAGHTVTLKSGLSHVFSHFGSGTFRNAPTYWSKYCTFSPAYLLYEYDSLPLTPKIFIDRLCPINTHYDVLFNRSLEASKGLQRLGSCGVGFGATIQRHVERGISLMIEDLFSKQTLKYKLTQIREYYKAIFLKETNLHFGNYKHDEEDKLFIRYVDEIHNLVKTGIITFVNEKDIFECKEWECYIFEGAQGVLLDKQFGNKPFITQSFTTSKNALEILSRQQGICFDIDIHYVTRSYLTRHGGGPFDEFPTDFQLYNTVQETNIENEFQGPFKKGFLNINLLDYALICDGSYSTGLNKNLIITCIDQLPTKDIFYNIGLSILHKPYKKFATELSATFNRVMYSSCSCSECLEQT